MSQCSEFDTLFLEFGVVKQDQTGTKIRPDRKRLASFGQFSIINWNRAKNIHWIQ